MFYFDTETCGLHGPIVLLQYAVGDGEIILHNVFTEEIQTTLDIIEMMVNHEEGVCGFNLAFDWFHICQTYTTLRLLGDRVGFDEYPIDHIDKYAEVEPLARDGKCLKPITACDLLLYARKGPYQSTMDRKDIRIKKVPVQLARPLAAELEKRVQLKDLYFSRKKDPSAKRWQIEYIERIDGTTDPDFVNLVLRFGASAALKVLAQDALGVEDDAILLFADIDVDKKFRPIEAGWAPFALAISSPERNWAATVRKSGAVREGFAWPGVIRHHISHWNYNTLAREYANKDVVYTRDLHKHFGKPESGDDDSVLACAVGAMRWRGYKIDVEGITSLRNKALKIAASAPKAPKKVFEYISEKLTDVEKKILQESTKKTVLEELSERMMPCPECSGSGRGSGVGVLMRGLRIDDDDDLESEDDEPCSACGGSGNTDEPHPASGRAKECLEARQAAYDVTIYNKLLQAGRFHASFKVIGTLSSRMSGADGLNPQGIDHAKEIRSKFPLAFGDLELCGGDAVSYEVSIADADYNDPELRKELTRCEKCKYVWTLEEFASERLDCPSCGKYNEEDQERYLQKFHGLFGMALAPGKDYDDILASKGTDNDLYDKGKRGGFLKMYGGNANSMVTRIGVSEEVANNAEKWFEEKFTGVRLARELVEEKLCTMRQPGGLGKQVVWSDPEDYIESLTGFPRYFTVENMICKVLYNLANKLPPSWRDMKIKCVRREDRGEQFVGGAVMSALYAAAFAIQAQNLRAGANHRIQSTGATAMKDLQRRIWNLQPSGITEWHVQPMNIHDEIMCPAKPELKPVIRNVVRGFEKDYRPLIPLIKMDWVDNLRNWAEK